MAEEVINLVLAIKAGKIESTLTKIEGDLRSITYQATTLERGLRRAFDSAAASATKLSTAFQGSKTFDLASAEANLNRVSSILDQMASKANKVANNVNGIRNNLNGAGDAARRTSRVDLGRPIRDAEEASNRLRLSFGPLLKAFAAFGLYNRLKDATTAAADLEIQFAKIAGLIKLPAGELESLVAKTEALSAATAKSQLEIAMIAQTVESAGFRGAAALDLLERATKAEVAGIGEAADIVRVASAVQTAYGKDNINTAETLDILTRTFDLGIIKAKGFTSALGQVISPAQQAGVSFKEVASFIAAATKAGFSAETAITRLVNTLKIVSQPTKQERTAFALLNDTIDGGTFSATKFQNAVSKNGLIKALQDLYKITQDNGKEFTDLGFDLRGNQGALVAVGNGAAEASRILLEMGDNAGAADRAFQSVNDTTGQEFRKSLQEFSNVLLDIGKNALPLVTGALQSAAEGVRTFQNAFGFAKARTELEHLDQDMELVTNEAGKLRDRIKELENIKSVLGANFQGDKELKSLQAQLTEAESRLRSFAKLRQELSNPQASTATTGGGAVNKPLKPESAVDEKAAKKAVDNAQRLLDRLTEQVALYGEVSNVAKVRYDLEHGSLGVINEDIKKQILAEAELLDQKVAGTKASKEAADAEKEAARARQQAIKDAIKESQAQLRVEAQDRNKAEQIKLGLLSQEDRTLANTIEKIKEINRLRSEGNLSESDAQAAIDNENTAYTKLVDDIKSKNLELSEDGKMVWSTLQGYSSHLFFDVMQGNFDDLGKNFKATLDRMVADLLSSQLFGAASGAGAGGGGLFGTIASFFGGGAAAAAGTKGAGGPVSAGMPVKVGDRGPELFIPDQPGRIVPNGQMGGGNTTINVTVNAQDAQSFVRAQGQVANTVAQALSSARRKNG